MKALVEKDETHMGLEDGACDQLQWELIALSTARVRRTFALQDSLSPSVNKHKHRKGPGRRKVSATLVLEKFSKGKASKHPRKEYLRMQLLRNMKKCVRFILDGKKVRAGVAKFSPGDPCSETRQTLWAELTSAVNRYRADLTQFAQTSSEPEKAFNDAFIRQVYSPDFVRELHYYFCSYALRDREETDLCERLKFQCCRRPEHSDVCKQKWRELTDYICFSMLEELSLKPFGQEAATDAYSVVEEPAGMLAPSTQEDDFAIRESSWDTYLSYLR